MYSLTVIVPCKNEEKHIAYCIDALLKQQSKNISIIVVDNGSTDSTLNILHKYNDKIKSYLFLGRTISSVRNFGASKSSSEWIAFIDADTLVDRNWYNNICKELDYFKEKDGDINLIATGSTCGISSNASWIEKMWYRQLEARDKTRTGYINSANFIISRFLYSKIGGFDEGYATGEDEKICSDVVKYGGKIVKDPRIKAIHLGYPKDIKGFFRRAYWHGLSVEKYLLRPWQYRDVLIAYYNIFCMLFCVSFGFFLKERLVFLLGLIILLFIPPFFLSLKRCRGEWLGILQLTWLYFIYGLAKSTALLKIFANHFTK